MQDSSDRASRDRGIGTARLATDDSSTPLAHFPWSDGIVGMGYFPHEVDLPAEWQWSTATGRDAAA